MIGIDTNILLRPWLNDDPAQNRRIDALLAEHGSSPAPLLVTDFVLAEALWTLKSAFEQDKAAQLIAVRSLLEETAFAFEDREAVLDALSLFAQQRFVKQSPGPFRVAHALSKFGGQQPSSAGGLPRLPYRAAQATIRLHARQSSARGTPTGCSLFRALARQVSAAPSRLRSYI